MTYFVIFLILFFSVFLIDLKLDKKANNLVFTVLSVILIFFVGFRGDIEPDYINYLDIYNQSSKSKYTDFEIEPLYLFLNKLVIFFGGSFPYIVFIMSLLSLMPKLLFFKKYSPNFALSITVFFCSSLFFFDFIAIRQAVAIGIFMYSLKYIQQRKLMLYFLLILIASLFHISALILLPCYFVLNRDFSRNKLYFLVGICAVVNLLQINVNLLNNVLSFFPLPGATIAKLAIYSSETEFAFITPKQIVLGFLFIYIKGRTDSNNKMLNICINVYILGIILGTLLNELPQFSYRIKWYFFTLEALLIPFLVLYFSKKQSVAKYVMYFILIIIYGYYLFTFFESIASRGDYIFPYKFFFE